MAQIACLGWGSLVWDPRELSIRSAWFEDGPFIAVDFLRQSKDGRMTLVLDNSATPVRSLWAQMDATGSWSVGSPSPVHMVDLDAWAQARGVQHVVWTALTAKFGGEDRTPGEQEILGYLRGLTGAARDNAERYIRRAPRQIDTPLRRRIVAELNWSPIDA